MSALLGRRTPGVSEPEPPPSILRNRNFLLLWAAQGISQSMQNAIFYSLMVFVESTTGSSTQMSILVLTTVIPTVAFGIIAGVFVDRVRKRTVLIVVNLVRTVLVIGFLLAGESLAFVFLFNLLFSITSQFFLPAESSLIPLLVSRRQLLAANGIFNLTFTSSQLAGFVLIGPALVKLFGQEPLYLAVAATLLVSSILVMFLPAADPGRDLNREAAAGQQILASIRAELAAGWELLRGDLLIRLAILYVTLTTMLTLIMGMLAPGYVARVIGIQADDAVFVMAPAGLGILAGILGMARFTIAKTLAINSGLLLMAGALFLLALAPALMGGVRGPEFWLVGENWPLIAMVMVIALALGIGFALVQVPGQTILAEQAPAHMRGKVFAVQLTLGSLVSVPPLVLLGGLADIFGVTPIVLAMAGLVTLLAAFSLWTLRRAAEAHQEGHEGRSDAVRPVLVSVDTPQGHGYN